LRYFFVSYNAFLDATTDTDEVSRTVAYDELALRIVAPA
jgi:hypothetical protein